MIIPSHSFINSIPVDTIETLPDGSSQTYPSLTDQIENVFSYLEVTANQFYDSLSVTTTAIFMDSSVIMPSFHRLPDEALAHIVIHLTHPRDFDAFAATSKKIAKIAHSLPVYAFHPGLQTHVLVHHDQFKKAAEVVIRAIIKRPFTQKEASRAGAWTGKQIPCGDQELLKDLMEQCHQAENVFYDTMERCCFKTDGKINNNAFSVYLRSAFTHLINRSRHYDSVALKLQASVDGLCDKFYRDIIEDFIDVPHELITPDSFDQKLHEITGLFAKKDAFEVQADLKQALKLKHGYFLKKLANSCLYSTSRCPLFAQTKQQLLTDKITCIKAEILELCGSTRSIGKIQNAYLKVQEQMCELALLKETQVNGFNYYDYLCVNLEFLTQSQEIEYAKNRLGIAQKHYCELTSKLEKIAQWLYKHDISAEKSMIEFTAKQIVLKMGFFYEELCQ